MAARCSHTMSFVPWVVRQVPEAALTVGSRHGHHLTKDGLHVFRSMPDSLSSFPSTLQSRSHGLAQVLVQCSFYP